MMKTNFSSLMIAAVMLICLSACKTQTVTENNNIRKMVSQQTTVITKPVNLILDADFGSSTDDLFALMMIHHYIDEGKADLKGVIVDREGEKNAGVVDIFNTYYGHPDIPIGLERNGVKNPRCFIPYNGIYDLTDTYGAPLFKRTKDLSSLPEGYKLYRQLLSQADDKSIAVVAIGFATTLSQLFESQGDEFSPLSGLDLFEKKVKAVYIQSGRFEAGDSLCGYNMRAASKQSAVFYDKLPKSVDIVMSPSNIGDQMNYVPQDVLADLSYTEVNPIKSVYTYYHCDTGQRMWDTNCLVNAVMGDEEYNLSPRGWVTFIEKGKESMMLFLEDPNGNARYQIPGDSYFNAGKLMDIRRHNRINSHPAPYTIEAPQPQITGEDALAWARPRTTLLMDKYLGTAGNNLDPDEVRNVFRPIGYNGTNLRDYREAEQYMTDNLYAEMLKRAVGRGKKDLVIVTGAPASGKSTAVRQMDLSDAGLIYDAALLGPGRLEGVIDQALKAGMEKVTVVMVYNDILTSYKNTVNRGKTTWRYTPLSFMVSAFRANGGRLASIHEAYPNVEIIPIDNTGNKGATNRVSLDEALKWDYSVSEEELSQLLSYLLDQINSGEISGSDIPAAAGNVTAIEGMSPANKAIAAQIDQKVQEQRKNNR
ncbi:MAG: hypothetical protein K6A98_01580 [Prevotella sp.]|nr:hypothetical protein [Prevotella sp.]